jgi:gliding motility-associated-like protein
LDVSGCSACNLTEIGPLVLPSGDEISPEGDIAICPDGSMFTSFLGELYSVDPTTGMCTILTGMPLSDNLGGLACAGDGILYGATEVSAPIFNLYEFNVNTSTLTILGLLPFPAHQGMFFYQNDLYMSTVGGMAIVDTINPANSSISIPFPSGFQADGATVYGSCNAALVYKNPSFYLFNMIDGSLVEICSGYFLWTSMTSQNEFLPESPCSILLDLDCDDSSLADEMDYNAPIFTCLTPEGVPIADEDAVVFSDVSISQMTVSISTAFMPDGINEILDVTMATPNVEINGTGTSNLVLQNMAGMATANDFINALHAIVYINNSIDLTPGIRTIEVQYLNIAGSESLIASAFVPAEEVPIINIDLGPDLILCEGETTTLNAGNPGSLYAWSTAETTQTITASTAGIYAVTVNNGVACPNADTVTIDFIPVIEVALAGDDYICDNEIASLTITLSTSVPVDIEIESSSGQTFVFNALTSSHSFTDPITGFTEYELSSIVPSLPACLVLADSTHSIEVLPTFHTVVDTNICEGDSVWLGTYWQSNAGTYGSTYPSILGCDSIVTTHISLLPEVMVLINLDTCDASAAGVFTTFLDHPDGCDTIIQTTITLLPVDTTHIVFTTCISTQAGTVTDTVSNPSGCDSIVLSTTTYIPPTDTTYLFSMTCDSSLVGISYDTMANATGCDSIIAHVVIHSSTDTTYINSHSCIPGEIGVFENVYPDIHGCDSIVISTIMAGMADTTRLFSTSCDPSSIGVFETLLLSSTGCDSLIISTIIFSAQDSTFVTSSTCDPASSGVFVSLYTNQIGCDSIVTETISLNTSHFITLSSSTCFSADTGVFTQYHSNQFGCDSVVTTTVTLLPSDAITIHQTTCLSSEAGTFQTHYLNQYGCDSLVTTNVDLIAVDTTRVDMYTCNADEVESFETNFIGHDGCDSLVIENTILFPLPILSVQSAMDFSGFDISCFGQSDGSVNTEIGGVPPFSYLWSTNATDPMITGLSAGAYSVSVTDGNGCMTSGEVVLFEPDEFMIAFEIPEPDCFDQELGSLTVHPSGGVEPFQYSIDGMHFQLSPAFTGIADGIYQIVALDANECSATEIISIDVPLMVHVNLGENQVIQLGDSTEVEAIINLPLDSITSMIWTGIDSNECQNCLTQIVAPVITTAYSVFVTSNDGCSDRDSVLITVTADQQIAVPNVFSPNGDGINDALVISTGDGILEITAFSIFDRWGNLVFNDQYRLPGDPALAWDGRWKGKELNPGVYVYTILVRYADGESKIIHGDITLIR